MSKQLHGKALLRLFMESKDTKWLLEWLQGCIVAKALAQRAGSHWAVLETEITIREGIAYLKNERNIDLG